MERPFSEEEVFRTIMDMKGDKAPRQDGFSIVFYQKC